MLPKQPWGKKYTAFTVAELGEMLPTIYIPIRETNKAGADWILKYPNKLGDHWHRSKTEADARAKMLIYPLENKLVTL